MGSEDALDLETVRLRVCQLMGARGISAQQWDYIRDFIAAYDRQTELLETVLLKHQDARARLAAAHEALGLACAALRFWPHGEPTAALAKCRAAYAIIDDAPPGESP